MARQTNSISWSDVGGKFAEGMQTIGEGFGQAGAKIADDFNRNVAAPIGKGVSDVGKWCGDRADDVGKWCSDRADDVGKWCSEVGNAAAYAGKTVARGVSDFSHSVADVTENVLNGVGGAAESVWEGSAAKRAVDGFRQSYNQSAAKNETQKAQREDARTKRTISFDRPLPRQIPVVSTGVQHGGLGS